MPTRTGEPKDVGGRGPVWNEPAGISLVFGQTSQGSELQGTLLRLSRFLAVFEVYHPGLVLRLSEVLSDFKIVVHDRTIYAGPVVVRNLIHAGLSVVCEVALNEGFWVELAVAATNGDGFKLREEYESFIRQWGKLYKVLPEFKIAVADMHSFLSDLRLWLEQIELGIRSMPEGDRLKAELAKAQELLPPAKPALMSMFERFESAAAAVPPDLVPVHHAFCRRQLHPLLLCSPFTYRIFAKPLGYAGDYEMMNMIIRNECEGSSLFAKILHAFILDQGPGHAVRNRVNHLARRLVEETKRVVDHGKTARIYSLGCGPAREVENFLKEHPLSEQAEFELMDFNEETLAYAGGRLHEIKERYHRQTPVRLTRRSVYHLMKNRDATIEVKPAYDVIYCSGLYDYLTDRICKALNTRLYDLLKPGGVLIVTNFDPYNPIRNLMEFVFDWFLFHRDGRQLAALAPERASREECKIVAEPSGCNIFLEIRKPE